MSNHHVLCPADAFHKIWTIHKDKHVPLRVAAFVKALQEVTRAEIHRGFD